METVRIKSFNEFHNLTRRFLSNRLVIYRGHNDVTWPLVPKAARPEYRNLDYSVFFPSFKRRAVEFLDVQPETEWDWLAVAQHHGLPTPLLDWSYNPLVAAYFAVFPEEDRDAAVYAFYDDSPIDTAKTKPSDFKGVGRIIPRGVAQRIVRQGGIFTFHSPTSLPVGKSLARTDILVEIVIDRSYRREMIVELDKYGINRMTLFPDLDGLCAYMSWSGLDGVRTFWKTFGKKSKP
jgi:hypothetical protein